MKPMRHIGSICCAARRATRSSRSAVGCATSGTQLREKMNRDKMVWVELRDQLFETNVIRIFRNKKAAHRAARAWIDCIPYREAVGSIRHMLFVRSGGDCEICGERLTEVTGQMHEKHHRGRGGEISLENSVFICAACHGRAHKERNPRWNKNRSGA
jgi:5-methylcytosine-specific restriction endonuclease McrA